MLRASPARLARGSASASAASNSSRRIAEGLRALLTDPSALEAAHDEDGEHSDEFDQDGQASQSRGGGRRRVRGGSEPSRRDHTAGSQTRSRRRHAVHQLPEASAAQAALDRLSELPEFLPGGEDAEGALKQLAEAAPSSDEHARVLASMDPLLKSAIGYGRMLHSSGRLVRHAVEQADALGETGDFEQVADSCTFFTQDQSLTFQTTMHRFTQLHMTMSLLTSARGHLSEHYAACHESSERLLSLRAAARHQRGTPPLYWGLQQQAGDPAGADDAQDTAQDGEVPVPPPRAAEWGAGGLPSTSSAQGPCFPDSSSSDGEDTDDALLDMSDMALLTGSTIDGSMPARRGGQKRGRAPPPRSRRRPPTSPQAAPPPKRPTLSAATLSRFAAQLAEGSDSSDFEPGGSVKSDGDTTVSTVGLQSLGDTHTGAQAGSSAPTRDNPLQFAGDFAAERGLVPPTLPSGGGGSSPATPPKVPQSAPRVTLHRPQAETRASRRALAQFKQLHGPWAHLRPPPACASVPPSAFDGPLLNAGEGLLQIAELQAAALVTKVFMACEPPYHPLPFETSATLGAAVAQARAAAKNTSRTPAVSKRRRPSARQVASSLPQQVAQYASVRFAPRPVQRGVHGGVPPDQHLLSRASLMTAGKLRPTMMRPLQLIGMSLRDLSVAWAFPLQLLKRWRFLAGGRGGGGCRLPENAPAEMPPPVGMVGAALPSAGNGPMFPLSPEVLPSLTRHALEGGVADPAAHPLGDLLEHDVSFDEASNVAVTHSLDVRPAHVAGCQLVAPDCVTLGLLLRLAPVLHASLWPRAFTKAQLKAAGVLMGANSSAFCPAEARLLALGLWAHTDPGKEQLMASLLPNKNKATIAERIRTVRRKTPSLPSLNSADLLSGACEGPPPKSGGGSKLESGADVSGFCAEVPQHGPAYRHQAVKGSKGGRNGTIMCRATDLQREVDLLHAFGVVDFDAFEGALLAEGLRAVAGVRSTKPRVGPLPDGSLQCQLLLCDGSLQEHLCSFNDSNLLTRCCHISSLLMPHRGAHMLRKVVNSFLGGATRALYRAVPLADAGAMTPPDNPKQFKNKILFHPLSPLYPPLWGTHMARSDDGTAAAVATASASGQRVLRSDGQAFPLLWNHFPHLAPSPSLGFAVLRQLYLSSASGVKWLHAMAGAGGDPVQSLVEHIQLAGLTRTTPQMPQDPFACGFVTTTARQGGVGDVAALAAALAAGGTAAPRSLTTMMLHHQGAARDQRHVAMADQGALALLIAGGGRDLFLPPHHRPPSQNDGASSLAAPQPATDSLVPIASSVSGVPAVELVSDAFEAFPPQLPAAAAAVHRPPSYGVRRDLLAGGGQSSPQAEHTGPQWDHPLLAGNYRLRNLARAIPSLATAAVLDAVPTDVFDLVQVALPANGSLLNRNTVARLLEAVQDGGAAESDDGDSVLLEDEQLLQQVAEGIEQLPANADTQAFETFLQRAGMQLQDAEQLDTSQTPPRAGAASSPVPAAQAGDSNSAGTHSTPARSVGYRGMRSPRSALRKGSASRPVGSVHFQPPQPPSALPMDGGAPPPSLLALQDMTQLGRMTPQHSTQGVDVERDSVPIAASALLDLRGPSASPRMAAGIGVAQADGGGLAAQQTSIATPTQVGDTGKTEHQAGVSFFKIVTDKAGPLKRKRRGGTPKRVTGTPKRKGSPSRRALAVASAAAAAFQPQQQQASPGGVLATGHPATTPPRQDAAPPRGSSSAKRRLAMSAVDHMQLYDASASSSRGGTSGRAPPSVALVPEYPPQQIAGTRKAGSSDALGLQAAMDIAQANSQGGYSPRRVAALGGVLSARGVSGGQATPGDGSLGGGLTAFMPGDLSVSSLSHAPPASSTGGGVSADAGVSWTREMDELLLTCMLQQQPGQPPEQAVAATTEALKLHDPHCRAHHVAARMQLYRGKL